jgi:predicted amidophosphoribosyltransferase
MGRTIFCPSCRSAQPVTGNHAGDRPALVCAECGAPLADAGPGHQHDEASDPRWAVLKQLDDQATDQMDRHAGAIDLQEG